MGQTTQLNRKTQEVAVLANVAQLLTSLDIEVVLTKTLSMLTLTVGADRGSFFLFDEKSQIVERIISRRNMPLEHTKLVVSEVLERGLAGWVFEHRESALVNDTREDDRWVSFPDDPVETRSALCVPFISDGQLNGIMTLEHLEPEYFNKDDMLLATAVANQATIAIRNAQLFQQTEQQERQLQAVLGSTKEGILAVDQNNVITLANPSILSILETSEDLVGMPLSAIKGSPMLEAVLKHLVSGTERLEFNDEANQRDFSVQIATINEGQELKGHVIVFNDITALKEAARVKSQVLQIASHDLKNPLSVVLGYTNVLMMDMHDMESEQRELVESIARVSQGMMKMVTQLLDLERVESAVRREFEPLEIKPILDEVLLELTAEAFGGKVTLVDELSQDLPTLVGDAVQLRAAVFNLVENAVRYTPAGGTVTVRAWVAETQNRFCFEVEDTGYGIPDDAQANIFQRFFRAKQKGTEHISGTGLGLSLVKSVIERHGGKIWFTTALGEGSTFSLWLPLPELE